MRILVVEDEKKLAAFLKKGLAQEGFAVEVAHAGEEALQKIQDDPCDLVILDVNLPDRDGLSVLKRLRALGHATPVLMLTARDSLDDKVKGLESGANDYLTKPFAFRELIARIRVLLRPPQSATDKLSAGDLSLDLLARRASRGDQTIDLTNKEFALLELLLRHVGRPVSRARLWAHAWDNALDDLDSNVLDVHIGRLRRKIDDSQKVRLIQTVHGTGYKIDPQ
jgi:two-component system, OmpR family, copper resistance phosphate regulon response regulator CusR